MDLPRLHPTCKDVSSIDKQPETEFLCGPDCPPEERLWLDGEVTTDAC